MASKLLSEQEMSPEVIGEGGAAFLLRETGEVSLEALALSLTKAASRAHGLIDAALKRGLQQDQTHV